MKGVQGRGTTSPNSKGLLPKAPGGHSPAFLTLLTAPEQEGVLLSTKTFQGESSSLNHSLLLFLRAESS